MLKSRGCNEEIEIWNDCLLAEEGTQSCKCRMVSSVSGRTVKSARNSWNDAMCTLGSGCCSRVKAASLPLLPQNRA
jgi:hypothetical protein